MAIVDVFTGDNLVFICKVNVDITDCEIRAELWDDLGEYVRKATSNVEGGGSDQIEIIDLTAGRFKVHIAQGETTDFSRDARLQIKLTTSDLKEHTIAEHRLTFQTRKIDWTTLSNVTINTLPFRINLTIPIPTITIT